MTQFHENKLLLMNKICYQREKKSKNSTNLSQISEDTNDDHGKSETSDLSKHPEKVNCHERHAGDTITRTFSAGSSSIDNVLNNTSRIDNEIKYNLIKNRVPHKQFIFVQRSIRIKAGKVVNELDHVNTNGLNSLNVLYIPWKRLELPCILFPIENTPGGRAKILIILPYNNWKDAVSDLKSHAVCRYHKASFDHMHEFMKIMENEELGIDYILDRKLKDRVEKNRAILKYIKRCLEYCGRRGIALRGHRDDEDIEISHCDTEKNTENLGNFKELLKLACDLGDETKSASYTSKTLQNELLLCIKNYIQSEIIDQSKKQPHGPLFEIQADESTDIGNKEQLGIALRYLAHGDKSTEKLIEFVECQETTGGAISEKIIERVNELGFNMPNCRSQSYDGAANMAGVHKGCATKISEVYPKAKYYYCLNHDLNLAVSKSCQLPEMQIMLENTKQLGIFSSFPITGMFVWRNPLI